MSKVCPVCQQSFGGEEFCPVHFTQLVTPVTAQAADEPEPVPDAPSTKAPAAEATGPVIEAAKAQPEAAASDQITAPVVEESLVQRAMNKLGGRFKKKTTTSDSRTATEAVQQIAQTAPLNDMPQSDSNGIELPPEVRQKGWTVTGAPVSLHGIDVWPVQRVQEELTVSGQLVVYASGVLTDVPTYEVLLNAPMSNCRVHLHSFGTLDRGHKVRAAYELLILPGSWQDLAVWLADTPPSEERALSLLPGLRALVADWFATGVFPICLDPTLLQRGVEGNLRIVRFGAMWLAFPGGTAAVYRPELAHSNLLPAPWAAPEVKGRLVVTPQSAVFSLGQILAMALFGYPHSLHDVQGGLVPFQAIHSPELARILMGCLWPHADGRWNFAKLRQALNANATANMPEAPAWSRLMPGAAKAAFGLGGESFYRLEDAIAQANQPRHWAEATQNIEALLLWATGTAWKGVAEGLREGLTTGERSADWTLVRLTRQVRPDLPLTWRGLDMSDTYAQASLVALAQEALTSKTPDFTMMRQLIQADLRGAFSVPG